MTARDRWTVDLSCKPCGSTGSANVSQEDGWSFMSSNGETRIDSVSKGFKKHPDEDFKFLCSKCGGPA